MSAAREEPAGMRRARSVAGPLRRAHPASGATWNVQVVRGKMSSTCLWHACRALSVGLLLMLLGGAMATIGYYADTLSVAQEIRGNSTISVKDEARGFHLNNLSYAGPIVMGFGGFIVVAACVMTFEARDSAAKVTPARPQSMPRPAAARRGPACAARLDTLGVYRLPHALPLPHAIPLPSIHRLRGHQHPTDSASAAESECGSQSSLALDLHASAGGAGAARGVTLRVRDNMRRRPLARQPRLRDDSPHQNPNESGTNISLEVDSSKIEEEKPIENKDEVCLVIEPEACSPPPSPRLVVTSPRMDPDTESSDQPPEHSIEMECLSKESSDNQPDAPLDDNV